MPAVMLLFVVVVQPLARAAEELHDGDVHLGSSRVYVHVGKVGLGHEHAVMGKVASGHLRLSSAKDAGEIVFDISSFVADKEEARRYLGLAGVTDESTQRQVTANMLGKQVLDAQRFPTSTLRIGSAELMKELSPRGLAQYKLLGDFTLHGVTLPVTIVADVEEKDGWQHLRGGCRFLQSQFGIQPFTKAFGTIGVADAITVWGDFWIRKGTATASVPTGARR